MKTPRNLIIVVGFFIAKVVMVVEGSNLTQMDESSVFATTVTFASPKITKIDSV
jgi:hypothetical protein